MNLSLSNAANNAFKRSAFGLIDYYLEEEKQKRRDAEVTGKDPLVLAQEIDDMWGKVTLYNAYQLFVILSSKKSSDPEVIQVSPDEEELKEKDFLTLFFDASKELPMNSMRQLVQNTDDTLRAMAQSDKTIASVYGIALTAMSFFTDPTISTLTSGKPSQNFDAKGLSFPRRMGVRFSPEFLERYRYIGHQAVWTAYKDSKFEEQYDPKLFNDQQGIDKTGWARYFFDGKFEEEQAYVKLQIRNPDTGLFVRSFYFEVELTYKTTLDGKSYIQDPITKKKIIKNGVLREMKKKVLSDKSHRFVLQQTMVDRKDRDILSDDQSERTIKVPAFSQTSVHYNEKPKMVFFITPPHLKSYAKLILILISQMVNVNFEQSYMTKADQKPLYKTRYMIDELGNLQSEGNGIPGLETMLSIGLGQDQQFTLILQTIQQLRDVYGDSVDKVIQGNTNNIIFLKSTDDAMLDMLVKLSGQKHESTRDSKTVTQDIEAVLNKNEGKVSYTMTTKEKAVITFNDMLFIPERNSMLFRAGNSPIWNRNQTVLPMSWRLLRDTIRLPEQPKFSLQTVPTLSSAMDFDIRKNQPNFYEMLRKRVKQANCMTLVRNSYREAYGYTEHDMELLDPDVLSDDLMRAVNNYLSPVTTDDNKPRWVAEGFGSEAEYQKAMDDENAQLADVMFMDADDNVELTKEVRELQADEGTYTIKRYAGGIFSKDDFVKFGSGSVNHQMDRLLSEAYQDTRQHFANDTAFRYDQDTGELRDSRNQVLIKSLTGLNKLDYETIHNAEVAADSNVYSDDELTNASLTHEVTDAFVRYLASLESWHDIADGRFESAVEQLYKRKYVMDDITS